MANMNVSYDQMRDAATRLTTGKDDIGAKFNEMSHTITQLVSSGYVTDSSSSAFHDTFEKYVQSSRIALDALDGLAGFLVQAADALQQTDTGLAGKIRGNA